MICEREIPIQQQRINDMNLSFRNSLQSFKLTSQQSLQSQAKVGELKDNLREVEDDLVKALAVKTRKEARHIALSDSISSVKAEISNLKTTLHERKARKEEYAAIMSEQSLALVTLEEKANQGTKEKEDLQEIISWYNRVLGLRIEGGRGGIKVMFNNITPKDPTEEYSFVIKLKHDTYKLLKCDPQLNGTEELIDGLNQTNGFFKFVRIMREKFQVAASIGSRPQPSVTSVRADSSTVSVSAPASPVSHDGNEFLGKENTVPVQTEGKTRQVNHDRTAGKSPGSRDSSPGSAPSVRRSSRVKASHESISSGSPSISSGSASSVRRSSRVKASSSTVQDPTG